MYRITNSILVCFALVAFPMSIANAEDSATQTPAQRFENLNKEFEKIDADIRDIIKKFRAASADQRGELREQYEQLATRGKSLLPKLRESALAAYQADPNKNEDVTRTLLQVVAADIQADRYQDAKQITDLLVDNDCETSGVHELAGVVAYCTHDFDAAESMFKKAKEANELSRNGQNYFATIDEIKKNWKIEQSLREKEAAADDLPRVKLATSKGDMIVELYENEAPQAVGNFINLVEKKFYDGLTFHRVLGNFMAQGGCPAGTGTGGPGYHIYCECEKEGHRNHFSGSLSMAHAGKDTGGSQFYITFRPTSHLDGRHTVFGRVIEGMDVLAELQRINPGENVTPDKIVKATVVRKRDHEYKPTKVK